MFLVALHSPHILSGSAPILLFIMPQTITEEEKGIQVICAGLGRTGTLSLTEAFNELGYKSYHYVDLKHAPQWADYCRAQNKQHSSNNGDNGATGENTTVDDIIDLIVQDGYTATLENPTSDIYPDLLRRYPDAKVILTVRDTPSKFVTSWKILFDCMVITETKFSWCFPSFFGYIPTFANLKTIRYFMGTTFLGLDPGALTHGWRERGDAADAWIADQYERHNQHIIDHVPSNQLLVFNVKQGWKPLCEFLEKEVPSIPFPHCTLNSSESLESLRKQFQFVVYAWIPTFLAFAGTALYFAATRTLRNIQKAKF